MTSEENKPEEQLKMKDSGYLRVPQPIKQRFGSPRKYPQPTWAFAEDTKTISLTFTWQKKELNGGSGK